MSDACCRAAFSSDVAYRSSTSGADFGGDTEAPSFGLAVVHGGVPGHSLAALLEPAAAAAVQVGGTLAAGLLPRCDGTAGRAAGGQQQQQRRGERRPGQLAGPPHLLSTLCSRSMSESKTNEKP